jgi:peptidoglycan lytic transglycosylase D
MAKRVRFWVRIFTQVSTTEAVLHDRDDLTLVYDVTPLGAGGAGGAVDAARASYDHVLLSLVVDGLNPSIPRAAPSVRRVAAMFADHSLGLPAVAGAIGNIRAQQGLRETFAEGLVRAAIYLPAIRRIFREAGLPLELAYLPHVESSFNPNAVSRSGAAGLWQLTAATGGRLLRVGGGVDERFDPIRSTQAAARHLARAYGVLGSWPLAVMSYNHGVAGLVRARDTVGAGIDDIVRGYESPSFGFASRNFYAELLAAVHVAEHVAFYFPDLDLTSVFEYRVRRGDSLWTIARRHRVSVRGLMADNSLRNTTIREGQVLVIKQS